MTAATATLADFLLARIAEDETVAREAQDQLDDWTARGLSVSGGVVDSVEAHKYRWFPTRVLAECEAKRRIVEEREKWNNVLGLNFACRALALPYADHPDYREEWRL